MDGNMSTRMIAALSLLVMVQFMRRSAPVGRSHDIIESFRLDVLNDGSRVAPCAMWSSRVRGDKVFLELL